MRFPDRRESGEARPDGGQPGSRPRGRRQSAARPRRRSSKGERARAPRLATHRRRGRGDRPGDEDRAQRSLRRGGPGFAEKLAKQTPIAIRLAKVLLNRSADTPIDAALEMEAMTF